MVAKKNYIHYADGTVGFRRNNGTTEINYKQISEEEYNRLSAMTYGERNKYVESTLSDEILCGYGYYGNRLYKDSYGMYFLGVITGRTC